MRALAVAVVMALAAPAFAQWTYSFHRDPMTDAYRARALVASVNTHNFRFPYQGGTHAAIVLRDHPSGDLRVLLMIDRGQFSCGMECRIQVRFDDEPPEDYWASGPDDGSSDVLFIGNTEVFLQKTKDAKRMRVAASFFQHGTLVYEFRTAGLQWPPEPPKVKPKAAK